MRQLRTHDLIRLAAGDGVQDVCADDPAQGEKVQARLEEAPWVVVRRSLPRDGWIAVGVRGQSREERYAAWIPDGVVREVIQPMDLLVRASPRSEPAFEALRKLRGQWSANDLRWGPAGSVGFELASGCRYVTAQSDLDVVVFAPEMVSREAASKLLAGANDAGCRVDIQVETPHGGFALREFADGGARVLLRTAFGPQLVTDPWSAPARETVTA